MKLSDQAIKTAIMLFQKALIELKDISDLIRNLDFELDQDGKLKVTNPETVELDEESLVTDNQLDLPLKEG